MENDYDIPLEDYDVPYVTIEEMKELLMSRKTKWSKPKCIELQLNEGSGLYYTNYFTYEEPNMLQEHLLVELCLENLDKLDWKYITNGYDFDIIERIQHLMENPLVWVDEIPGELIEKYVITGRVAVEKSSEERNTCPPYCDMRSYWIDERLKWFANQLPQSKDLTDVLWVDIPKDMILWDRILTDPFEKISAGRYAPQKTNPYTGREFWAYCNPDEFRRSIKQINNMFGTQKSAQIVRLLRADWPDIKALKLFGIDKLSPEQIEGFRECLFEGMDRNLRIWDAETSGNAEEEQSAQDPDGAFFAVTDKMSYDMCKKELLRIINSAKNKSAACREILRSEAVGYFVLSDKTDQEKAAAINPWVALSSKKYVFTGDDFRKARNS